LTALTCSSAHLVILSSSLGSRFASPTFDNGFQVVEIALEGLPASGGEPASCLRPAADKLLVNGDVAVVLQLLQVNAQVAVGHVQLVAQLGEGEAVHGGEHGADRQPAALVQHRVQLFQDAFESVHDVYSCLQGN